MPLFNKILKNRKAAKTQKTINRAGGQAFVQSPKMKLVSMLLTSFAQDQFYRTAEETFSELIALLAQVDPKFAAKTAIYARNEYGMRSITHVLAGELAAYASGQTWAKEFYRQIVRRPDDMLEIAAYFNANGGKNLPNAMKKGFAAAFDKFDGYQIAKYRGAGKAIKLVDIVNMVHPLPNHNNATALQSLVDGTLKNTETWEALLTAAGQHATNETDKRRLKLQAWNRLLAEGKLGYFALVRNLRNILAMNSSRLTALACEQLTDRKRIKKSLVLPFRLIVAWKQLTDNSRDARKMRYALERAIDMACNNVPYLDNTLVVIDNSGSMHQKVANSNKMLCNEMGAAFGMMLAKRCNADILEFATNARYINYSLGDSVMEFATNFEANNKVGHGTNFHSIFQTANRKYDRIVIFSDMQGWMGHFNPGNAFNIYKAKYKANPFIYSFDLAAYGALQFPENKVFCLAGFSEKVFGLMQVLESNPKALIQEIEAVRLYSK